MNLVDIKKLANMARVEMDENEMEEIANSFDPILSYVGQIKEVSETDDTMHHEIGNGPFNVFREDIATNESGEYTDKIMKQAPEQEDGFIKVKQIL